MKEEKKQAKKTLAVIKLNQADLDKLDVDTKADGSNKDAELAFREKFKLDARKSARTGLKTEIKKELGLPDDANEWAIIKAMNEKIKGIKK